MLTTTGHEPAAHIRAHTEDHLPTPGLRLCVLRTPAQRQAIRELRRLAATGAEQDMQLGLEGLEDVRDDAGLVLALYRAAQLVATMRVVPTGQGLTAAERLQHKLGFAADFLGAGSWELGRLVMRPEDRNPEVLAQFFALGLRELPREFDMRHFHATAYPLTARLWRRMGFRTVLTTTGSSGATYCLVHARTEDAARALHLQALPQGVAA